MIIHVSKTFPTGLQEATMSTAEYTKEAAMALNEAATALFELSELAKLYDATELVDIAKETSLQLEEAAVDTETIADIALAAKSGSLKLAELSSEAAKAAVSFATVGTHTARLLSRQMNGVGNIWMMEAEKAQQAAVDAARKAIKALAEAKTADESTLKAGKTPDTILKEAPTKTLIVIKPTISAIGKSPSQDAQEQEEPLRNRKTNSKTSAIRGPAGSNRVESAGRSLGQVRTTTEPRTRAGHRLSTGFRIKTKQDKKRTERRQMIRKEAETNAEDKTAHVPRFERKIRPGQRTHTKNKGFVLNEHDRKMLSSIFSEPEMKVETRKTTTRPRQRKFFF